jgi:hypothetical protein
VNVDERLICGVAAVAEVLVAEVGVGGAVAASLLLYFMLGLLCCHAHLLCSRPRQ